MQCTYYPYSVYRTQFLTFSTYKINSYLEISKFIMYQDFKFRESETARRSHLAKVQFMKDLHKIN